MNFLSLFMTVAMIGQTGGIVGKIVDTPSVQRTVPQGLTSVAATSGSTASATFAMPFGYTDLLIYAGDFPIARDKLILYVKVDSTTTPVHLYPYGCVCVKGVSGKTLSFGSQTVDKQTNTTTNESVTVKVLPHIGKSLRGPFASTAVTKTVLLDHGSPNFFSPVQAQILFKDEYSVFTIAPSSVRRDIFMMESDGALLTPVRHLHLPANQTINVACHYKFIALFSSSRDINSLVITCPEGTSLPDTVPYYWEPDFTPSATITVNNVADFKTHANGSMFNEIVFAPGVYDFTASGDRINSSNYSSAFDRNLRIRSSTGNPDDVIFNFGVDISLTSSKSWIFKGIKWNLDGTAIPTGKNDLLTLCGNVHLVNCIVYGATSTAGDNGQIAWEARTSTGPTTSVLAWCTIQKSARDNIGSNNYNSQQCTVHAIGSTIDGNGPQSQNNDQLVTSHFGGAVAGWGCRLKDSATGNQAKVASDTTISPIHLAYCYSRPEDITNTVGMSLNGLSSAFPSSIYLLFCDFQNISNMNNSQVNVGSLLRSTISGNPVLYPVSTTRFVGCDVYGPSSGVGVEQMVDAIDSSVELVSTRLTMTSTTQTSGMVRFYRTTGGPYTSKMTNCTWHAPASTATPAFSIATASEAVTIKNCVFGGLGQYTISGSADQTSTIQGSFLQKKTNLSTAPSNWDARFSATTWASLGTNVKSASDPPLDSFDVPTQGGTCDGGINPGFVGSTDIYGRPYLGGTFVMGAAERQELRSNAFLYPIIWSQ